MPLPHPLRCSSILGVPTLQDRSQTLTEPDARANEGRAGAASFPRQAIGPLRSLYQRGPASFTNLNIYSFGLTGLWTAVGSVVLPLMVSDLIAAGPVSFFGFDFDKNGAISIIALMGGAIVGITQPVAGLLSDRTSGPLGKRLPFILVGIGGLVPLTVILGAMDALLTITLVWMGMQFFGNVVQGPANALIVDHVPPRRLGFASGALILMRAAGGGLLAAMILGLMANYDAATSPQWLWVSLAVAAAIAGATALWTVATLRPRGHAAPPNARTSEPEAATAVPDPRRRSRAGYYLFLVALTIVIAGMSSLSMYAVFYMEDMVGAENPAESLLLAVAIVAPTIGLTVIPAGRLSDRIGRTRTLMGAGLIGAFGVLLLALLPRLPIVLVAGIPIGVAVAAFFTIMWALANDLVAHSSAARDLGLTGVAFLVGGGMARFAGFGIDALNHQVDNLGYRTLLFVVAAAFILTPPALSYLFAQDEGQPDTGSREEPSV